MRSHSGLKGVLGTAKKILLSAAWKTLVAQHESTLRRHSGEDTMVHSAEETPFRRRTLISTLVPSGVARPQRIEGTAGHSEEDTALRSGLFHCCPQRPLRAGPMIFLFFPSSTDTRTFRKMWTDNGPFSSWSDNSPIRSSSDESPNTSSTNNRTFRFGLKTVHRIVV